MGDSETKTSYTPEELEEIQRITAHLDSYVGLSESESPSDSYTAPEPAAPASRAEEDLPDITGDLGNLEEGGFDIDEGYDSDTDLAASSESIDEIGDEEITILDQEPTPEYPADSEFDLGDLTADESPLTEEVSADIEPAVKEKISGSALEQLTRLTSREPESVDSQDLAPDDEYVSAPAAPARSAQNDDIMSGLPDDDLSGTLLDELSVDDFDDAPPSRSVEIGGDDLDAPDLDGISIEDSSGFQEADLNDMPDIDLDGITSDTESGLIEDELPSIPDDDISFADDSDTISLDLDNDPPLPVQKKPAAVKKKSREKTTDFDDIDSLDIDSLHDEMDNLSDSEDELTIEPLDDDIAPAPKSAEKKQAASRAVPENDTLELSDRDLKKLRKAIMLFNPGLRQAVKDTVLNDQLPSNEITDLVDMIISGKGESQIRSYLEKKLNRQIPDEAEQSARRVITSRPEYTREGRERQKRLLKLTRIFGLAAAGAFVITILGYQFIYKPHMAASTIKDGVALILASGQAGETSSNIANINKAEELFKYVNENYIKDYLPGYNSYGRAYFKRKYYDRSLEKLNSAFFINPHYTDTLTNLGYFYSRVPDDRYSLIRSQVPGWYYKEARQKAQKTKLDVAIDFYTRVLIRDPKNITALVGIGNAYFYQGEYLKAKKYFEDILLVDPNSIAGFSGLLNLYIERDLFEQVVQIHATLRDKKLLTDIPSPLLAKTAAYYLGKSDAPGKNIRIDYGVRSPGFIDQDDKIYPAIRSILEALNQRDPEYPPLQIVHAKLQKALSNPEGMKRHLDKAVSLSPDFYAAHHLLGEFHFNTNEPVKAYKSLQKAEQSHRYPPEFTEEDFYYETESLGKTYAVMGNIFYYFFDRVKSRYGTIDNQIIEDGSDKTWNYNIAKDNYEKALSEKFESPELRYNLGRVYYLNSDWKAALEQWLYLYEDFIEAPELMLALGNAFYHSGNLAAARGEYLKLITVFENETDRIQSPLTSNTEHHKYYMGLSTAYNNLAAAYQEEDNESKSVLAYWKSIDYAQRFGIENEYSRVNLARAFKGDRKLKPIIDEGIPYSIKYYSEDMRRP